MKTVLLVSDGDLSGLQTDIGKYPVNLTDRNYDGHSLVSVAIIYGRLHILKWLLAHTTLTLKEDNRRGMTPWQVLGYEFGQHVKLQKKNLNWKRRDAVAAAMLRVMLMYDQPSPLDWSYILTEFPSQSDLIHKGCTLRRKFLDCMLDTSTLRDMNHFMKAYAPPGGGRDSHTKKKSSSVKKRLWKKLKTK